MIIGKNSIGENCRRAVAVVVVRHEGLKRCSCGALCLILLTICMAIALPSSPAAAQFNAKPGVARNTIPAPMQNGIRIGVIANDQLNFGQVLNFMVTVYNNGIDPVKNVHLFCRANPSGSFMVEVIDQPYVLRDENNQDVSLDDLYPGVQKQINFSIQAPMSRQIQGEWSHNFHFNFSIAADGSPESSAGVITLSTRQGKILVIRSGFTD
jgi:hypothetical protein